MKIAFFSSVHFGALGSPGTYKFIEKCLNFFDLRVFAPLDNKKAVYHNLNIPIIPVKQFSDEANVSAFLAPLLHYNPDILYLFNSAVWFNLLKCLHKYFPDKKFILDIKSPLLADGERRRNIQEGGNNSYPFLDSLVTLSEQNIPTWIPNCTIVPMVYPLGTDLTSFTGSKTP